VKRKRVLEISVFAEGENENVTFYTISFENDISETLKYKRKYEDTPENRRNQDIIFTGLELISCSRAEERHFRPASKRIDNVWELPSEDDICTQRLYCIRMSNEIVILGNGDLKTTRTYNEDEVLNSHVELLVEIDKIIRDRVKKGQIILTGKRLSGNLKFEILWD
jgi:hypothetical protein